MMIDNEELLKLLLDIFYNDVLNYDKEKSEDYCKGHKEGMLKIIEVVNKYNGL